MLGAPHGSRSVETSAGGSEKREGTIQSIGPVEVREEIPLTPALFAIGKEVENKLLPCRLVANARSVYIIRNGKYRNANGHFELAVLDASGQLLKELSPDAIGPDLHRVYGQISLRKEQRIRGRAVVLTSPGARHNYFHWCLELLPKIHLLRSCGLFNPRTDIFIVNHNDDRYQLETLELLGLCAENVARAYPGIKIAADELVVPSHSFQHEAVPRWSIEFVRESFLRQSLHRGDQRKLFLDRGSAHRRPIINHTEVREYLGGRGYAIVDPASLSFQEQVSLLRGARSIVSCHGAGLANLSFVEAGTGLLEIFSPFYTPDYFRVLSEHLGILYGCVSGVAVGERGYVPERLRIAQPFRLPLDRLVNAVESLERLA
jgi:hypothetical protein